MKRLFIMILCFLICLVPIPVEGKESLSLYAKSAILMEADSGRVLYQKEATKQMPNASTTKILTCYYVILHSDINGIATVSKNAAKQPQVALGVREGEKYRVKDLLYALMLESYNDCAVVLAEYVAGSTESFAKGMNQEAQKMGATKTHFITPNGLDGSDEGGSHRTTAYDLAKIMKYCLKNKTFLSITRQSSYSFYDVQRQRSFHCQNHNALLTMMPDAITGKTGFTSKAGYCYVGVVKRNDMTLIAVVLASGWPPHKGYKWNDVKTLFDYGAKHYQKKKVKAKKIKNHRVKVEKGRKSKVSITSSPKGIDVILREDEDIQIRYVYPKTMKAPIKKNEKTGQIQYIFRNKIIKIENMYTLTQVEEKNFWWYLGNVLSSFFLLSSVVE